MPAAGPQVAAYPFLQLRGEALNPAVHGRVVDRDAPVGQHPFEVAVADRELQVPAHGPQDHLGREAEAAECPGGIGHERYSRRVAGGSTALPGYAASFNATDPARCVAADVPGDPVTDCPVVDTAAPAGPVNASKCG